MNKEQEQKLKEIRERNDFLLSNPSGNLDLKKKAINDTAFLLSLISSLEEAPQVPAGVEAMLQEIWDGIEQNLAIRRDNLSDYPFIALLHGIRSNFNKYLPMNPELEEAFHGGKEYKFSVDSFSGTYSELQKSLRTAPLAQGGTE